MRYFGQIQEFLRRNSIVFSLLVLALSAPYAMAWDWKQTPTEASWRKFEKWSDKKKSKTWQSLQASGTPFEKMSWEWRLAWVKTCSHSVEQWCAILLQHGLFDKALIVRAETASRLGERFAGTGHAPALRLLATAYAIQQNNRHGEPLFIQYRILEAINQIGGPESERLGKKLARGSEGTARYWNLLASHASG